MEGAGMQVERYGLDLLAPGDGELRSVMEGAAMALHWVGADGTILWANPAELRMLGYAADEYIGHNIREFHVDEAVISDILLRLKAGQDIVDYEARLRARDGSARYVSITSNVYWKDGEFVHTRCFTRDITAQKRAVELQERLAAIVESSDDAIISKDLNGIIQSWNRGAERIFGYTAEEAIGNPVAMLAAPERVAEMPNILERIRRGERVDHYETKRRAKDGRILDISLTVSPIRDSSGTIVGASKIARDITERKRHEQERAALLVREREARETAELLNEIGPKLATELELDKLTQAMAEIATRLTGAEFGAVVQTSSGGPSAWAGATADPDAVRRFSSEVFRRDAGVIRSGDITEDARFRDSARPASVQSYLGVPVRRSGDVLACLCFGHSERERFNEWHERLVTGIAAQAAIALDNARLFTELRVAREAAERSNEELRRANADLEQFAFSASHDLKEPLRMIALYSQILQRRYRDKFDAEAQGYFGYVVEGARRMDRLVQDLLAYTQSAAVLERGQTPEPVDANSVLAQAMANLSQVIAEAKATVEHTELPALRITEVHLMQLFQNLIDNAIKYRGEETPRVSVSAFREGDCWKICVQDNGIGIAPQYREQVFGIFKRLHTSDKYSGTGIGLAICQRIVTRYGGRIWVESGQGGTGTTFCFTLPGADPSTLTHSLP